MVPSDDLLNNYREDIAVHRSEYICAMTKNMQKTSSDSCEPKNYMNCSLDGLNVTGTQSTGMCFQPCKTVWDVWTDWYFPNVIQKVYPVYTQERSVDNGRKAFELIKALMDKKLIKCEKVSDFIEAMDIIIKQL